MNEEKRKARPLTRDYLLRATYSYLERFATTEKNLTQVLERKVQRRLPEQAPPDLYEEAQGWIREIVHKAVAQNLVNDHSYAQSRAASLVTCWLRLNISAAVVLANIACVMTGLKLWKKSFIACAAPDFPICWPVKY